MKRVFEMSLALLLGSLIVAVICVLILVSGCDAGINIKPLNAQRVMQAYDRNQTVFISRCFTQNLCSEVEISQYKLIKDLLTDILTEINPSYVINEDKLWTLFE